MSKMEYIPNEDVAKKFQNITKQEFIHMLVVNFDGLIGDKTFELLIEREVLKRMVSNQQKN